LNRFREECGMQRAPELQLGESPLIVVIYYKYIISVIYQTAKEKKRRRQCRMLMLWRLRTSIDTYLKKQKTEKGAIRFKP
jgi:hypothetical protein